MSEIRIVRDYPHPPEKVWLAVTDPARYEHTGFTGIGGIFMAKLLGRVRTKMLSVGLPAVLDDLGDDGHLRPTSTLKAKSQGRQAD